MIPFLPGINIPHQGILHELIYLFIPLIRDIFTPKRLNHGVTVFL
jgi:hypothetical protein